MGIGIRNDSGYCDPVPFMAISNIERAARMRKPLVYVASPFSGDEAGNVKKAIRYCRFAVDKGAIPLAPHLFLPLFMSEEREREEAMRMNMVFLSKCSELWVFGSTISEGMKAEIKRAKWRNMPIRYFTEDCQENTED